MTSRIQTPHDRSQPWRTLLAVVLLALVGAARGQAQLQFLSPFEMVGFIQSATLDDPTDVFSGGTITLNNHVVVVPRNTILQMPATSLTWNELFKYAPPPYGPTQSGLAMSDTPKPFTTFEVTVQGNRAGDTYIAGLLFLSQHSLQSHQGVINYIDYATGDVRVGGTLNDAASGTPVRVNDPIGRFGRQGSPDQRFSIDENNPTVRSDTGFPMCVPRTDPAVADDPACPQKNRPWDDAARTYSSIFTMSAPPAPAGKPDPTVMAPFEIGDYVTYSGLLMPDGTIWAWSLTANVGIFTVPGTQPSYVAIDVIVMGTGNALYATIAQEGARKVRVEGFATDISRPIDIFAVDVDPCSGEAQDRYWGSQTVDPGPVPGGVTRGGLGAVAGRWRFVPGQPLFDLKGFPFLPPTREVHAVRQDGPGKPLANGLVPGQYQAPNFTFVLPENRAVGTPTMPANFAGMPFLVQGTGPWYGGGYGPFSTARPQGIAGQITPFPDLFTPTPADCPVASVRAPIAVAGPNQSVDSLALVTLNATASSDPNAPPRAQTFSWRQISGPVVTLANVTSATPTFAAPMVPLGGVAVSLQFMVIVDNGVFSSTAMTTVMVNPAATVIMAPTAVAGPNQTVSSGAAVALSGTGADPNTPAKPLTLAWSQTGGTPAVVPTPTTAAGASPAKATFTAPTLAAGASPLVLTFSLTVSNGATPPAVSSMTVTVNPPLPVPTVDKMVFSEGAGPRTTAPFSTTTAGERLIAFAASDGPAAVNAQTLTISGGGLNWTRVRRAATRYGDSEIWTATASTVLTNITVTSTQSATPYRQSLTVIAFKGVSGLGASGVAGAASGAPTISLLPQAAGSVVYAVGNDWNHAIARTIPAGQTKVRELVDTATGDTYWVQALNGVTAAGVTVTLNATAPTADQWNFAIVELKR